MHEAVAAQLKEEEEEEIRNDSHMLAYRKEQCECKLQEGDPGCLVKRD